MLLKRTIVGRSAIVWGLALVLALAASFAVYAVEEEQLSAVVARDSTGAESVYIFAQLQGGLEVYVWDGVSTPDEVGTPLPNRSAAPGWTASDPASAVYRDTKLNCDVVSAFVIGSDSSLWECFRHLIPGSSWQWIKLGVPPSGVQLSGHPAAVPVGMFSDDMGVFVTGTDGGLYEYVLGSKWESLGDPSAPPCPEPPCFYISAAPFSSPSVARYISGSGLFITDYQATFVVGSDGHLYGYECFATQWADLSNVAGAPTLGTSTPAAVAYYDYVAKSTVFDIFALDGNGKLWACHVANGSPTWTEPSLSLEPTPITSLPAAGLFYPTPHDPQVRVFCTSTAELLTALPGNLSQWGWQHDHSGAYGSETMARVPAAVVLKGMLYSFVATFTPTTVYGLRLATRYYTGTEWQWLDLGVL
ncbi:MAG: hypothetical protein ABFD77_01090 [Thermotogota bacterium]